MLKITAPIPVLVAAVALAALPASVGAQCSRVIRVPVAPIGLAITVVNGQVGGIYPDLLHGMAAQLGCELAFVPVPRARMELMFRTGQADLLLPARRSAQRSREGVFVPLTQNRAVLLSLQSERPAIASAAELLQRHELRVVVVRGYDYDETYQHLLKALADQGRLIFANDTLSVVRMLQDRMAEITIMAPSVLTGTLRGDPKLSPLLARLRYEPIPELPWGNGGVYVSSHTSLNEGDRHLMLGLFERLGKSREVLQAYQRRYPGEDLSIGLRPIAELR